MEPKLGDAMRYLFCTLLAALLAGDCSANNICRGSGNVAGCSGNYGNTGTTNGTAPSDGGGSCYVKQITGVCATTTTSVTMRLNDYGTIAGYRYTLVAYADSAGEPAERIAYTPGTQGGSATGGPEQATQIWAFTPAGSTVWVGLCAEGNTRMSSSSDTGGNNRTRMSVSDYSAPAATWTGMGSNDSDYNAYNLEAYVTY